MGTGECAFQQGGSMSVPEARGGCQQCAGSTSMVRRRRCRHGLAMLHISAQLHRQQLRPAVRHGTRLSTAIMPATHAGAAGAIACAHAAGRGPPLCAKALRFCTCSCTMRGTGQAVAPVRSQESCRIMAELPRPFGPSDPAVGRMRCLVLCSAR